MKKRIATLVAATLIATIPLTSANAGDRQDDAIVAGVFGLAAGLIAGHVISGNDVHVVPSHRHDRQHRHYRQHRQHRHVRPVRYVEPWTKRWYGYCSNTYRSFNPRTGTYLGYDGRRHFCTVPGRH